MRSFRALVLLAATALAAAGCTDDPPLAPEAAGAVGQWVFVRPADAGARMEHRISFGDDGTYAFETLYFGFHGRPADEVTSYLRGRGRFRLDDDVLMLQVARTEEWSWRMDPVVYWGERTWNQQGTVHVEGDRLTHTFVSMALDSPQTVTMVYQRER